MRACVRACLPALVYGKAAVITSHVMNSDLHTIHIENGCSIFMKRVPLLIVKDIKETVQLSQV